MQGHLAVVKYLLTQELNTERLLADRKVTFYSLSSLSYHCALIACNISRNKIAEFTVFTLVQLHHSSFKLLGAMLTCGQQQG